MLSRRTLAFFTAFCLLTTAFFGMLPSGPRLVCQFTGKPMAAVIVPPTATKDAAAKAETSCCSVKKQTTKAGAKRFVLTSPGCCELQQGAARADIPAAVINAAPAFSDAAVLASLPPLPRPFVSAFRASAAVAKEHVPRAPPQSAPFSRGPPFVS